MLTNSLCTISILIDLFEEKMENFVSSPGFIDLLLHILFVIFIISHRKHKNEQVQYSSSIVLVGISNYISQSLLQFIPKIKIFCEKPKNLNTWQGFFYSFLQAPFVVHSNVLQTKND
jgi:hypothetical protein